MTAPIGMTTGYGVGVSTGYLNNGVSNSAPATELAGLLTPGIGAPGVTATPALQPPAPATTADGSTFADVLTRSIEQLQGLQSTADGYAAQAATGDLQDVHDYMIAASEARLATDAVVTIRNKAVDAFNEIMRMPV